jgi:hypothetical protein
MECRVQCHPMPAASLEMTLSRALQPLLRHILPEALVWRILRRKSPGAKARIFVGPFTTRLKSCPIQGIRACRRAGRPAIRLHLTYGMACAEYRRLEHQYQAAVRLWKEFQAPLTVLLPGRPIIYPLKQEALLARNRAADLLYLHRRCCPDCKKGEMELIDLSKMAL